MGRLELQNKLSELLGSNDVYFQPPASIRLKYPCIIYNLTNIEARRADNVAYNLDSGYEIMYITKDPDDGFKELMIREFPKCRFNRFFTSDNLNHYVFILYY